MAALNMATSMDLSLTEETSSDAKGGKKVKFGKVRVGKKKQQGRKVTIGKALDPKKRPKLGGIRKPSSVMRKTLKKLAQKSEMVCHASRQPLIARGDAATVRVA